MRLVVLRARNKMVLSALFLPYLGCRYSRGTSTRRVFSVLSRVTYPLARLRICAALLKKCRFL